MPFIPFISYRYFHRTRTLSSPRRDNNIKDTKVEEKPKVNIPTKCTGCLFRYSKYCFTNNKSVEEISPEIIANCKEMEKLAKKRASLKSSKWLPINKTLLKSLLADGEEDTDQIILYENFEAVISNFEVWELLNVLSFSEMSPFMMGNLASYDDYFKVIDRYFLFLDKIENQELDDINQEKEENTDNYTNLVCDYATLVLLKNYLFKYKDNDNAKIIQELIKDISSIEDIESAIELIYEEGLLTIEDPISNKLKKS